MRRLVLATSLALVCLVAGSPALGSQTAPTVRLLSLSPLKVTGSHFRALERVKVTAPLSTKQVTRTARASANGTFTVTFSDSLTLDRCSGAVVRVVPTNGLVVMVRIPPRMCAPASTS